MSRGKTDDYVEKCRASGYKTLGVDDSIKKLFESFNDGSSYFQDSKFDLEAESLKYRNRRINTYCIPLLNFLVASHLINIVNKINEVSDETQLDLDFSLGTKLYRNEVAYNREKIVCAIYHRFFKELPEFTDEQTKDIDKNMKAIDKAFRKAITIWVTL